MWSNDASGHGTSRDPRSITTYQVRALTDIEGMQLWRNDDVMGRIVELKPREAMRRGFTVRVQGSEGSETDEDKKISEAINAECKRLQVTDKVRHAGQTENAAGGCAIFPVMDGALGELDEELDENYERQISRIEALHILEPRELYPQRWYTRLQDVKFRQPSVYRLQPLSGATGRPMSPVWIHETRLVVFPGMRVTAQYQPGQRVGWGDPAISRPYEAVSDFGLSWGSVATLLRDFAHGVFKLHDLANILGKKNGEEELAKRINAMQMNQSTLRAAVIDKNDDYQRTTTPTTGLEGLLVQMATRVALAADIPVTKLFGMSPAGLNATGESDTRGWYDNVEAARSYYENMIRRIVYLIMCQADGPTGGRIPEFWTIEWPPLWQPSEKEQAETRYIIAQTDQIYATGIGAVDARTIATSRWQGGKFSPEMSIDWVEYDKQHALDTAQLSDADMAALGKTAPNGKGAQIGNEPDAPAANVPDEEDPSRAPAKGLPPEDTSDKPDDSGGPRKVVKVREHERAVGGK